VVAQTLTFDTATPGAAVAAGGQIESVNSGAPVYEAGIHGAAGIRFNGGTASNCQARILTGVGGSHSGSFYFRANALPATGAVTFVQSQSTVNANHWALRYNATGQFLVLDNTIAGVIPAGAVCRFDYQYAYVVGGPSTLLWRLFVGANAEGATADLSGSAQISNANANPITKIQFGPLSGTSGAARDMSLDTFRTVDGASWFAAYAPPAAPAPGTSAFSVISAQTADGFTVRSKVTNGTAMRLLVCSDAAATTVVKTIGAAAPGSGYITHTVTGLAPHTRYYAQLEDTPTGGSASRVGSVLRARTAPTPGAASSFTFAMGSCMSNDNPDGSTFDDLRGWDPDFLLHSGDFHYKSSTSTDPAVHVGQWESQIANAGGVKAALAAVPIYYTRSDHEAGPDSGDSNNAYTAASIAGYKTVFPTPPLPDTRTNTSTYFSFPYGRVKVIVTDFRNTDRSPGADPQSGAKTALGATQKAWLKTELSDPAYPVKFLLSDVAWIGPADLTKSTDKWWAYADERQEIANHITANGIKVVLFHGDTHSLMADDGTNNAWGGFPVVCGSPFGTVGGGYNTNIMQQVYNTGATTQARQYQRVTVTDDGTTISVNAVGWDVLSGGVARTNLTRAFASFVPTPGVTMWDGTKEVPVQAFVWDGTKEIPAVGAGTLYTG
jgi:alkaline phosphatase D